MPGMFIHYKQVNGTIEYPSCVESLSTQIHGCIAFSQVSAESLFESLFRYWNEISLELVTNFKDFLPRLRPAILRSEQ